MRHILVLVTKNSELEGPLAQSQRLSSKAILPILKRDFLFGKIKNACIISSERSSVPRPKININRNKKYKKLYKVINYRGTFSSLVSVDNWLLLEGLYVKLCSDLITVQN